MSHRLPARLRRAGALLAVLSTLALTMAPPAAAEPAVRIEWGSERIQVYTHTPAYALADGELAGCAGTARIFFENGNIMTLPGVALGEDACSAENPPCAPYEGLPTVAACEANPLACCVPITIPPASVHVATFRVGCLYPFWIVVDGDDGVEPVRVGPLYALSGCF